MNLLDLSNKEIDSFILEAIQVIAKVAAENRIKFFVVGAVARDIILNHGHGLENMRGTKDIDLAFQVSTWKDYQHLLDGLIKTGNFNYDREPQRIKFQGNHPVDIIPFGPIGDENEDIHWPPSNDTKMSIMGFEEAYDNAQWVRLKNNPDFTVRFATPVGLTIMKMISWQTGSSDRKQKDAYDLKFLIKYYCEAGNEERLYNEYPEVLEKYEFDNYLAGAYLLGMDISKISKIDTLNFVLNILNYETEESSSFELVNNMFPNELSSGEMFGEILNLLKALKSGIEFGASNSN